MLIDKLQGMTLKEYIKSFADNPERVFEDVQEIVSATEKQEFDEFFPQWVENKILLDTSLDEPKKVEMLAENYYFFFKLFFSMRIYSQISVMRYYRMNTTKSHQIVNQKLYDFAFHNASPYEKRVLGAIYEIGESKNKVTPTRIIKTLKQDNCYKPSKAQLDKVKEALHILDGIEVNPKRLEPFSSPVSPESLTDRNLQIEEFFHKVLKENSIICEITYSDICKACNIQNRSEKSRLSKKYRAILNKYKRENIITGYVENENGIIIHKNK